MPSGGIGGAENVALERSRNVRDEMIREQLDHNEPDEDAERSLTEESVKHRTRRDLINALIVVIIVALVVGLFLFVAF